MRILFYAIIVLAIVILLRLIFTSSGQTGKSQRMKLRFRKRPTTRDMWVQVYDTDSLEEAQALQAGLEEEEIECFVYEQGRKDVHGNPLKGFGIAVPRTSVAHAQRIIARMPA